MAYSLDAMIEKGKSKYRRKIELMHRRYEAAKDRAISNFEKLPFGPTIKAAYREAWNDMPTNYKRKVTAGIEEKWATNWRAKITS